MILDRDCLTLAALHSDAVDYPKSGRPVALDRIPGIKFKIKPDWNAPETAISSNPRYYESHRAIGKLFRAIKLPALTQAAHSSQVGNPEGSYLTLDDVVQRLLMDDPRPRNAILKAVRQHVMHYIDIPRHDADHIRRIWELYRYYVPRLRGICADHTLSWDRGAMLTEEEAVVGTIVAKCSQPRKRKERMSHMREQTASLADGLRTELAGDEDMPSEYALEQAWIAFRLAAIESPKFGARSFGWLALGGIFEATREIDELERISTRSVGH